MVGSGCDRASGARPGRRTSTGFAGLLDEGITVDNLREGEAALDTLWLAVHPGEPVPPAYDFRMTSG